MVTLAADGAVAADPTGGCQVSAPPVTEIDPVGAGDSFVAGYLASFLDGADPSRRLHIAATAAAMSVSAQSD